MDDSCSKLHSKVFGSSSNEQSPFLVLSLYPASTDLIHVTIPQTNPSVAVSPLFSIKCSEGGSKSRQPDLQLLQAGQIIGDASSSLLSMKTKLSLRGQQLEMTQSATSGDFKLNFPPMQDLRWKVNQLTGSSLELRNGFGQRLGRMENSGPNGGQKIEIYVPCENNFVDLVVLSGYAAWILNKTSNEVATEVLNGVLGV